MQMFKQMETMTFFYRRMNLRCLDNSRLDKFAPRTIRDFLVNSRLSFWTIRDFHFGQFATLLWTIRDFHLGQFVTFSQKAFKLSFIWVKEKRTLFIAHICLNKRKKVGLLFEFSIWNWVFTLIFLHDIKH